MCMYSRLSVVNPMTLSALTWCTCGSHLLTGLPSNWVSFRPLSINPTSTHNLLSTFLQLRSPITSCCSKAVLSFLCASPASVSPMLSLAPTQGLRVSILLPPARASLTLHPGPAGLPPPLLSSACLNYFLPQSTAPAAIPQGILPKPQNPVHSFTQNLPEFLTRMIVPN